MKKFMELTVQMKLVWSIFFAGAMLIYVTVSMIAGNSSMDLITVWQLVGLTLVVTFIHYLFFGEMILTSFNIKYKILIHSILCYVLLLFTAHYFVWIDMYKTNDFIIFTSSYMFLYLACINSFYIYYKSTGEELNKKLTAYKQKKSIN
jgi:hypothetical protein